ncbi:MAG: pilin, partial [Patescibacteria group bacterium]|nr:pilin [Patescibacteria group bacterium]
CGADESCDEKVMGNVCSPPAGGRCNANGICEAAVAATHMACSADGWCVSVTGAGADECDPDDADGHDECGCTCSDGTICENCSTVNLGTYCNSSRELETDCNDHDCCPAGTTCNLDGFCITLGCDNIKIDFDNEDGSDTKYEVGDDITVYGSCDIVGENFGMSLSTGDSDGFVGCTTDFLEIESTITGTGTITATVDVMPSGLICTASIYADDPPTPPAPPPPPACNNDDHKDATEVCDGTDLDGKDCTDFGCTGGILACVDCAFDTSGCTGCGAPPPPPPPPPPPGPTACDPNSWFFCNPLRTNVETLAEGGERIIGYILGLIGSVFLLLIVISGAMYMTSAGNEERIASSKKILTAAVIGLAIALLAYSLLAVIMKVLGM